jgi:hypothetical protein
MRTLRTLVVISCLLPSVWLRGRAAAQESEQRPVSCRDRPCSILIDWTRAGGIGAQSPDRRYGNPTLLEKLVKARLAERDFPRIESGAEQDLRVVLVPVLGNAMCDEVAGTSTDRSCRAIVDVEARVDGPDEVRRDVDLPSRIRNRCSSDKVMPIDRLGAFVGDWIVYALEGKAKGDRRPVARC